MEKGESMSATRKKSLSIVYNGVEAWRELSPYIEQFSYTDAVGESDKITLSVIDRDMKWAGSWIPKKGDVILPAIILENWDYEGEKITFNCGSFVVDDFSFSAPPLTGNINGVSAPVNTSFKESDNSRTWEAATIQVIAAELAGKYGLELVYDAGEIQVAKAEQNEQPDSEFLKSLCDKYGLGLKVYANRLVIWDYKRYYSKPATMTLTPNMVSKWDYKSTMQGTYTGAKVSYSDPSTKKLVSVVVGSEERLYKTTQKADNEADARLIGEGAILKANRKETTMQIQLPPRLSLVATENIMISGFGKMDGKYFIEKVSHQIRKSDYNMRIDISRVPETEEQQTGEATKESESNQAGASYTIKKGDTLWQLAQKFYGDPAMCTVIYEANKEEIENAAKQNGKNESNRGYWIFPGQSITIP